MTQAPWKHHQTNKCKTITSNQSTRRTSSPSMNGSMRSIHHSQIRLWNFYQISPYSLWFHPKCPYFLNSQRKNLFMAYVFLHIIFPQELFGLALQPPKQPNRMLTCRVCSDTSSIWCESVGIPRSHSLGSSWFVTWKKNCLNFSRKQKPNSLGDVNCDVASQLHSTYISSDTTTSMMGWIKQSF